VIVTRSKPSSRRNMAPCLQFTGVSTTVTHNPSSPSKRARRFHHRRPATVTASASVTPVRAPLNLPSSLDRRQQNRKLATTTVRRVVMAFMGRGLATCPVMTTGTATAARCCVGPAFSADSSSPPNFAHRRRRSVRAFAAGARSGTDTGDRPDVARLAEMAQIRLTTEEAAELAPAVDAVVGWFGQLREAPVDDVEPLLRVEPADGAADALVLREDVAIASDARDAILAAAPERDGDFLRVPRIGSGE